VSFIIIFVRPVAFLATEYNEVLSGYHLTQLIAQENFIILITFMSWSSGL